MRRGIRLAIALSCLMGTPGAFAADVVISNTATFNYVDPDLTPQTLQSNTTEATVLPNPTPATINFYNYNPTGGGTSMKIDGAQCWSGSDYSDAPTPTSLDGSPIDTLTSARADTARAYHIGEPVFFRIEDLNHNKDPLVREYVEVVITTSSGDSERIRVQETGVNTGLFAAVIMSTGMPPAPTQNDCQLSLALNTKIMIDYVDSDFPTDTAEANVLVDPYGVIFNSSTGAPIDGVTVKIVNALDNSPAAVFDDDGLTSYPSTVISGQDFVNGPFTHDMPAGGFRFPLMAPGNYKLVLENVPSNFTWPTNVPLATLQVLEDGDGNLFSLDTGYDGGTFTVAAGPALNIDIPVDPIISDLVVSKTAAKTEVSVGDFLRYEVSVRNANSLAISTDVTLRDKLPRGFKYKKGSLRIDGVKSSKITISDDGRDLSIDLDNLAPSQSKLINYVVEITSGASDGKAINSAYADRGSGSPSNTAQFAVIVRPPFFTSHATLMGRVLEGACTESEDKLIGVPNVKLLMEDGTYVVTDSEGMYHIEKVTPGTHVLQVDETTLNEEYELVDCQKNTRFAGRKNSQFIDVQGGSLWRADFYLRKRHAPLDALDVHYQSSVAVSPDGQLTDLLYTVDLAAKQDINNVQIAITLPRGVEYLPMSGRWQSTKLVDGQMEGDQLIFRFPAFVEGERGVLTFRALPHFEIDNSMKAVGACIKDELKSSLTSTYTVPRFIGEAILNVDTPTCTQATPKPFVRLQLRAPRGLPVEKVVDDIEAGGGTIDWLDGQAPGLDWLFPKEDYNPRSPVTRVVVKHAQGQKVDLRVNGAPVSPLLYEGALFNQNKSVAIAQWRGVPLVDGPNQFEAAIIGVDGSTIQLFKKTIYYSNVIDTVELLPAKSLLVADGITKSRIAIRVLDKYKKPVRKGVRGSFQISAPYIAAQFEEMTQKRQLSGLERFEPEYMVINDEGLAYVELAPTTTAGEVKVNFPINETKHKEFKVWLEPDVRDWVVVGFAEGTAGYNTLSGNMQDLPGADKNKKADLDGQTKLYAKGRISGKWIMTLALDSEKRKSNKDNFGGIIQPGEFYTLYGDGTTQRNDSPSSDKLYLKLERSKFYALFGDYTTDLTDTQLGRYNRSFTGAKSGYVSEWFEFKAFASQTDTRFKRDEIQGQGDSLQYRLSRGSLVLNSEKIRKQTRDRLNSTKIIEETALTKGIDYYIDYRAGTLRFAEPILSRDKDGNPQFIIAEYEVEGVGTEDLTYGGRIVGKMAKEKIQVGLTHIQEDDGTNESDLQSVDLKIKVADETELKAEASTSKSKNGQTDENGTAYLAELEHRSKELDANAYVRNEEDGFGLDQGGVAGTGRFKAGADVKVHVTEELDLKGKYNHEHLISNNDKRNVMGSELEYHTKNGSVALGFQQINEDLAGEEVEVQQVTAGVSRKMFNNKLEAELKTEQTIGSESESIDYPARYLAQLNYKLTDKTRIFAAQELTDGKAFDSSTTRVGFETVPWAGSKLNSTVNQQISEAGPRSYSTMGLSQSLTLSEKWSMDATLDGTQTLNEKGPATPFNANHPIASGGSLSGSGAFTEDFLAMTLGATYRAKDWSWNIRAEKRFGEIENKWGLLTSVIKELDKGVVISSTAEVLASDFDGGAQGKQANADVSLAYRPITSRWAFLDKLKFRYETVDNAQSLPIFGQNTLQGGNDLSSSAVINNFTMNRLSPSRKNQYSLFYGAKYVLDKYDNKKYKSFTDMWGLEMRQDLSEKWDLGFQGSLLHSWMSHNMSYSFGPSIGWTPATNSWVSVGYNFKGFQDRDFDAARYTQQGVYLKIRVKFDEKSLGLKKESAPAQVAK